METKYIVVGIADEWYEEGKSLAIFNDYNDTLTYLKVNKMDALIGKLDYLEENKENFIWKDSYELVISYY